MPVRSVPSPITGRKRELAALFDAADPARTDGTVTVVRGEPGIGKTTLVEHVAAACGRQVVRTRGTQSETVLPFSSAADLLVGLRWTFEALPDVQRDALEISLSLRSGPPGSPLTVCAGALGALARAAEQQPLLVVVDDLPWVDAPSRQVLMFVARRLHRERIAMVLTTRDEVAPDPVLAELPVVDVGPLSGEESRHLVRSLATGASNVAVEDVVRQGHGNPLALAEGIRHGAPVGTGGSSVQHRWSVALDDLPASTRTALTVLALSRSARRVDLEPVLADFGLSTDDLVGARHRGLVRDHGDEVHLRHGLLRPVVVSTAPRELRHRVLRRLAEHADDVLAVWYLAGAAEAPDDPIADRLAAAAVAGRELSGPLAAMPAWTRSAELTGDPRLRAERLLAAGTDALVGGRPDEALSRCGQALALRRDDLFTADVELVRVRAHTWTGRPRQAVRDAVRVGDAVRHHDVERAVRLYAEAATPSAMVGDVDRMLDVAHRVRGLDGGANRSLPAAAIAAYSAVLAGHGVEAARALDEAEAHLPRADPVWDAQALVTIAQATGFAERFDLAHRIVDDVVTTARGVGAPLLLGYALLVRADLETWAGRWAAAYADATEAREWSLELDQVAVRATAAVILARIDGLRGDQTPCREHAEESLLAAGAHGIDCVALYAATALGADALAAGDADTAVVHLLRARRLADANAVGNPLVVPLYGDLLDASVRTGDRDGAREVLERLDACAGNPGQGYAAMVAARARGLLADDPDEAEEAFSRAYDRFPSPFEHARTLLSHAETRRRWRRPTQARPLLLDALASFSALGARPWADRAQAELAAAGHRGADPRSEVALDRLSPQEFQIARSVAEGRNNVEAAAALFVSRKTVEAHLTRVYRKLGVRSRTELAALLATPRH